MHKKFLNNIYIADPIDPMGISLLKKRGFNMFCLFNFPNNSLIEKISEYDSETTLPSVLIIRSIRKILKSEINELKKHTKINLICTASSGFDNIDIEYANKLGFKILNVPDGNFIAAAEHTLAMILFIVKNFQTYSVKLSEDLFKTKEYKNSELYHKTIGIIGVGRVGSYLAKMCRSLNMKILGNDINKKLIKRYKWIKFCSLNTLLRKSDIITLHTPLDLSTKNLINRENLKIIKANSIVINCARGGIINENALFKRLKSGKLYYAGIDVFVNEPAFNKNFLKLNNIFLTPHQGGKTIESKRRISLFLAKNIVTQLDKYS